MKIDLDAPNARWKQRATVTLRERTFRVYFTTDESGVDHDSFFIEEVPMHKTLEEWDPLSKEIEDAIGRMTFSATDGSRVP